MAHTTAGSTPTSTPTAGHETAHQMQHGPGWSAPTTIAVMVGVVLASLLQLTQQVLERAQAGGPAPRVAWWVDHPTLAGVAMAVGLLAVPLLVLTMLVTVRLTRERSRRIATTGGCLLVTALVALAALQGSEQAAYWMVLEGDAPTAVRLLEVTDPGVPGVVTIVMLMTGAVIGSLLLAVALWRSGAAVLKAAAVAKVGWLACDFVLGWSVPAQVLSVLGAVLVASAVPTLRRAPVERQGS